VLVIAERNAREMRSKRKRNDDYFPKYCPARDNSEKHRPVYTRICKARALIYIYICIYTESRYVETAVVIYATRRNFREIREASAKLEPDYVYDGIEVGTRLYYRDGATVFASVFYTGVRNTRIYRIHTRGHIRAVRINFVPPFRRRDFRV